jgi:superfamily I DNA/RNA helicase/mRNA-degrading endonuclease RelE of RelBE toxin-antitoxin system
MDWTLTFKSNICQDAALLDKKTRKLFAQAQERLTTVPNIDDGKLIKKLQGYKNFWRLKMNNYRLIYEVDDNDRTVRCLMMGSKNSVYKRFGVDENGPSLEVIANEDLEDILEFKPTDSERGKAIIETSFQEKELETTFPKIITDEELENLNIDNKFHSHIKACSSEEDLQLLEKNGVDISSIEKILNFYSPPSLVKVINNPSRVSLSSDDFKKIADKSKKLEDFLLELDEVQKPFVNRFAGKAPQGPWLVKGGPGSGKSTVAIYCVKELLTSLNDGLDVFPDSNLNILFTTFNLSLVGASRILLRELGFKEGNSKLTITNIDDIARNYCSSELKNKKIVTAQNSKPYLKQAILNDTSRSFGTTESEFIFDEILRCIISEDLKYLNDYLAYDRSGRGRRLGINQKKSIWAIYVEFEEILNNNRMCTYPHRHKDAVANAIPIFDYVFIDEAQDFTPVQIKLCNKLVKNGNIFLTADANQSIYGSHFSWKRAANGLDFRGKATNLKTNYRTTLEIWNAILPIIENIPDQDKDTIDFVPFRHGEIPTMMNANENESAKKISNWILETSLEEKLPYSCAAILCPTNPICEKIASTLNPKLNAKYMSSKKVDIQWPGVKVMTMHAAKGLQFPIAVVANVNHGVVPFEVHGGQSQTEKDNSTRKLLFVACTRAMNRLLLVKDPYRPSRLLSEIPIDEWEEID